MRKIFGRKSAITTAIVLFAFGTVRNCSSDVLDDRGSDYPGVRCGGTLSLVSVIISDMTTLQERGKYIAFAAAGWAVGVGYLHNVLAGPDAKFLEQFPMGDVIGEATSWRWAFWINLPVCLVCFFGLLLSLKLPSVTLLCRGCLNLRLGCRPI
jgi:MFS family permease